MIAAAALGGIYAALSAVADKQEEGTKACPGNVYMNKVKPALDRFLSFGGLVLLSPVLAGTALAVFLDEPGPVLFTQKRVGKNGNYILIHKFRTMKRNTPHDVPTHLLKDPEQYITKVGRILRKTSLDELPQLWDIFRGSMSIIGPRPALWNQEDLIAEREQQGANDILPGLTGLAQVRGRDALLIPQKAALDGQYARTLKKGGLAAVLMDVKCFIATVVSVVKGEGVVEGGTGTVSETAGRFQESSTAGKASEKPLRKNMKKTKTYREFSGIRPEEAGFEDYGFRKKFCIDLRVEKKVLITGAHSYIGESLEKWGRQHYPNLTIHTIDMTNSAWQEYDFSSYDTVFHVAGIAHADVGRASEEEKQMYYAVNTDLALDTARKARECGVWQFIFMSSMIVYGESSPCKKQKIIDEETIPAPANFYGDSKWQADKGIRAMGDEKFRTAVLRPPMIYGKGSKGNYPVLAKLAGKLPVFPSVQNCRSMLHIDNLCEFLCRLILSGEGGVYFPQNARYAGTSELVKAIGAAREKKIRTLGVLNPAVSVASCMPGRIGRLANKAYGNMVYDHRLSHYEGLEYQVVSLEESIRRTEGIKQTSSTGCSGTVLMTASVASMIDQFNLPNIRLLKEMGYEVDVATNFHQGNTCTGEKIQVLLEQLEEMEVDCYQIDFDRNATDLRAGVRAFRQFEEVVCGRAVPINPSRHSHVGNGNRYAFVHAHSPIGGAVGRLAARKHGIKTIYTAHGFHFYEGAPVKNWLLYYPVEKLLSRITDVLITINREDYQRAVKKLHAGKTVYVPGVGIDTEKFGSVPADSYKKRKELGLGPEEVFLLSVGELNENKNHRTVIEALGRISRSNRALADRLHYCIAGKGP